MGKATAAEFAEELPRLATGAARLRERSHGDLASLAAACLRSVELAAPGWIEGSVAAKRWQNVPTARAEECLSGPLPVARLLRLLRDLHGGLANGRMPPLRPLATTTHSSPPHPRHARWSALPAAGLADRLLLAGCRAHIETPPDTAQTEPARRGGIALVLGAGNVTATPLLDVLHQVFLEGRAVQLKLSPLHRTLAASFATALAPLIDAGVLALAEGDAQLGAAMAHDDRIAAIHLTGAASTWSKLHADRALADKVLTAEVGCCTPALIVPGAWQTHELRHTAAQLAAFVAMNGGGTCLAPRVLVTASAWPQRAEFLHCVQIALAALPAREPFHPHAYEHFQRASGAASTTTSLPPTLRSGLEVPRDAALLADEHFAPVLLELPLPGDDTMPWLDRATSCVRERCFGSLSAYVFVPPRLRRHQTTALAAAIDRLPHGTIAINTWTGLGYGLGNLPWGVPPNAPIAHGVGWTRGTLCVANVQRSVIEAPFRPRPLPPWLPAHRCGDATLRSLCDFYLDPSAWRLLRTAALALCNP